MEENKTLISITVVSIPSKIQKTTMTRPKKILSTQTFTGYENCCPPFPFFFSLPWWLKITKCRGGRGGGDFHLQRKVWSPPRFLRTHLEDGAKEEKVKFQRVIKKKKKGKVKVVEKLCCVPHKTWFERRESRVPPPPRDEFFRQKLSLSLFTLNSRPTYKELSRIITLIYPFLYLFAILKDYIDNISRIVVDLIRRVLFEEATRSWWWPATCNRESETEDATISGAPASDN